jgi:hypothetical protein
MGQPLGPWTGVSSVTGLVLYGFVLGCDVSSCYTDGLVFHNDQYQAMQGYDSVVLAVVALVRVRVRLCLFTILGST